MVYMLLLLPSRFSRVRLCATHRRQPTRLPRPWDSPGKNTGVGCHFLLQCVKVKSESEVAQSCPTLSNPMDCSPPGSSVHGIFQAKDYFLIKPLFKDLCFGEFPWSPCLEQHSHLHASPYRCHHLTQFYTFLYAFALLCEDWMSCLLPHFQYLKCCLRLGLSWYLWMEGMKSKLYSLT